MKFLIAIVLYRVERKLTPLLKTSLSVFALPVFPSSPVLGSAAGATALVLPRCSLARVSALGAPAAAPSHPVGGWGHTSRPAAQEGLAGGQPEGCSRAHTCRAFPVWATPPDMDGPALCGHWAHPRDEPGHRWARPGEALGGAWWPWPDVGPPQRARWGLWAAHCHLSMRVQATRLDRTSPWVPSGAQLPEPTAASCLGSPGCWRSWSESQVSRELV